MGTIEERVALVEGRVGEQSAMMEAIRQSVDRLDQRFTALEARLDQRFAAIDQRFAAIDQRFAIIDQRFVALDGHLVALRGEMSRQLRWIVSIQITVLLAITGAVLSAFLALR